MKKGYRNVIIISVLLSVICLALLGDNFLSTDLPGSILAYVLYGSFFTLLFSSVLGISYYAIEKKRNAYWGILAFSVLLMLFLFIMDYTVWDVASPPPPASRIIFELLVYGGMYVGIFFVLFSAIYFALERTFKYAARLINK